MHRGLSVDLTGRTALVTGASSGIGAAVAEAYARSGARVYINYPDPSQAAPAEAVIAAIAAEGGEAMGVMADVSDEAQVDAMFATVESGSQSLDILVNNAGIAHSSPVESLATMDFRRVMDVHVLGTFLCSRAAPVSYTHLRAHET